MRPASASCASAPRRERCAPPPPRRAVSRKERCAPPPRAVLKLERCAPPLRRRAVSGGRGRSDGPPLPPSPRCAEAGALRHGAPPPRAGAPAGSHGGVKAGGRARPSTHVTGALEPEFGETRKVTR